MKKRSMILIIVFASLLLCNSVHAQVEKSIQLPAPRGEGGKPLMQALKERKTSREFSNESLSFQIIIETHSKNNPYTNRGISKVGICPDNCAKVVIAINL